MKHAVRRRMYAAAEAMLPGLRPQNLVTVARAAADAAAAMLDRDPPGRTMTPAERTALATAVEVNAEGFRTHLAKPSTAESWESFDVPWDHRRTLDAVVSGRYAAALSAEALWVAETLVALFEDAPPRTVRQARAAGQRARHARGGSQLLTR